MVATLALALVLSTGQASPAHNAAAAVIAQAAGRERHPADPVDRQARADPADHDRVRRRQRAEAVGAHRKAGGREVVDEGQASWSAVLAVDVVSFRRLTPADRRAVGKAAELYGGFMKQAVVCAQGLAQ